MDYTLDVDGCFLNRVYFEDLSEYHSPELYTISISEIIDGRIRDTMLNEHNKFIFFSNKKDAFDIAKYYLKYDFEEDFGEPTGIFLLDSIIEIQTKDKHPKKSWLLDTLEVIYNFYMTGIFEISNEERKVMNEFINTFLGGIHFADYFQTSKYSRTYITNTLYKIYGMILCHSDFLTSSDIQEIKLVNDKTI